MTSSRDSTATRCWPGETGPRGVLGEEAVELVEADTGDLGEALSGEGEFVGDGLGHADRHDLVGAHQ